MLERDLVQLLGLTARKPVVAFQLCRAAGMTYLDRNEDDPEDDLRDSGRRHRLAAESVDCERAKPAFVRRPIPHHRLHAQQLPSLRPPPDSRADAYQISLAPETFAGRMVRLQPELGNTSRPSAADENRASHCRAPPTPSTRTSICSSAAAEWVLILAGDHIYRMDYAAMLNHHRDSGAEATVACLTVGVDEAKSFGVMTADAMAHPFVSRSRSNLRLHLAIRGTCWPRWASTYFP